MSVGDGQRMFEHSRGRLGDDELPPTGTKLQRARLARLAQSGDQLAAAALRQHQLEREQAAKDDIDSKTGGTAAYDA